MEFYSFCICYLSLNMFIKQFDLDVNNLIHKLCLSNDTKSLGKRLSHHGNETQKSWKPLLNTIFALRGSLECPVRRSAHKFFVSFDINHLKSGFLKIEKTFLYKKDLHSIPRRSPLIINCLNLPRQTSE